MGNFVYPAHLAVRLEQRPRVLARHHLGLRLRGTSCVKPTCWQALCSRPRIRPRLLPRWQAYGASAPRASSPFGRGPSRRPTVESGGVGASLSQTGAPRSPPSPAGGRRQGMNGMDHPVRTWPVREFVFGSE